jgi:glutathione synthase/RimK-type ligase-like ATP-grasp enzyme
LKIVRGIIERLRAYHPFRVFYSTAYPSLRKLGIVGFLKKREIAGGGDPWSHNKNSENFRALFERYSIDPKTLARPSRDYLFGFLLLPNEGDIKNIEAASIALGTRYRIFDIRNPALFRELRDSDCDGLFIRPALENNNLRNFFHEATQVLSSDSRLRIYPSILELNIYEAKRTTANFLAIHDIPHPATHIFYDRAAAAEFIENASFPLVFKTHVGSSANGVEIMRTKRQALRLAKRLFDRYYLKKNEVENRSQEWGYMLFQEYVANAKEHRILKIGDSWFGHQKWKTADQEFFSGSGLEHHVDPPKALLDFCCDIADRFQFTTMNFDIFENERGDFLVNELQTWFGSYNPSQMYIDGVPGRYRKQGGGWVFEPGLFNVHGSMLLRIAHFVQMLEMEEGTGATPETVSRP